MKALFCVDIIGRSRLHQPNERLSWAPSWQDTQIHHHPSTPLHFFLSSLVSLLSWLGAWRSRVPAEVSKAFPAKHSHLLKSYCKACAADLRYHGQKLCQCLVSCLCPFFLFNLLAPCTHGNTHRITGRQLHNYTYTQRLIEEETYSASDRVWQPAYTLALLLQTVISTDRPLVKGFMFAQKIPWDKHTDKHTHEQYIYCIFQCELHRPFENP